MEELYDEYRLNQDEEDQLASYAPSVRSATMTVVARVSHTAHAGAYAVARVCACVRACVRVRACPSVWAVGWC